MLILYDDFLVRILDLCIFSINNLIIQSNQISKEIKVTNTNIYYYYFFFKINDERTLLFMYIICGSIGSN